MKILIVSLINFYQTFLSFDTGILRIFAPGGACLYQLRCSEYTKQMVLRHGVVHGLGLGMKRILSCNRLFVTGNK